MKRDNIKGAVVSQRTKDFLEAKAMFEDAYRCYSGLIFDNRNGEDVSKQFCDAYQKCIDIIMDDIIGVIECNIEETDYKEV